MFARQVPVLDEFSAASPDISSGDIETVTYVLPVRVDSLGRAAQYDIQVNRIIYIYMLIMNNGVCSC